MAKKVESLLISKEIPKVTYNYIRHSGDIEEYTKMCMIKELADYIMDNFDDLPVNLKVTENKEMESIRSELSFHIISEDELKRLKKIEWEHDMGEDLLWKASGGDTNLYLELVRDEFHKTAGATREGGQSDAGEEPNK